MSVRAEDEDIRSDPYTWPCLAAIAFHWKASQSGLPTPGL